VNFPLFATELGASAAIEQNDEDAGLLEGYPEPGP
jgi:hypothetical protein